MDPLLIALISFVAIIVLIIFLGLHVGTALIIAGVGGLAAVVGVPAAFKSLQYIPFVTVFSYGFAVVPLFILMGEMVTVSGVVTRLFDAIQAWFGRLRGGLGMAVVTMAAALGAITGSGIADCAILVRTAFPEMVKHKYDPAVSAGIIACAGSLAWLIPPSIGAVFYGIITKESIAKLLIAGLLPGILATILYMAVIYIRAVREPARFPIMERSFTWSEKIKSTPSILPFLLMMIVFIGGIYLGIFTPSEGGAIGCLVGFLYVLVLQRRKTGRLVFDALWRSAATTSMFFFITIGAMIYSRFMASTGAGGQIIGWISSLTVSPYITFALLVVLYLILGCFMEAFPIMAITLPIAHPLMKSLGFDPIWFGVVVVILSNAGGITPPFGLLVFAVKGLIGEQVKLWDIFMNALPFLASMIALVVLITIWPQIVLFLPARMN